jgi:capsular exopolysaccharide synthesis family protein
MGKYTDIFEKYNEEQLQRSTRVDEPETALKDDAQPESPSPQPPDAPAPSVPVALTAPLSPKIPTYNFQLKPSQLPPKNMTPTRASTPASGANGPATQKHPPPVRKKSPKNGAAAGKKMSPMPKIETTESVLPLGKSPVKKRVPCANGHNIDPGLISILNPYSLETDLFKTLRGKILFPVSGEPPKSLMVTSAVPGEGKTYIASNLAVNMAQNIAEYVLLLDGDLRRPRMHKMFGFDKVKGLSDHLSNGTGLSDLLLKTVVDKLTLLPAGTPPLNPSEILSSAKMAHLIDDVKTRYDDRYLIIDSPPSMLAPETRAIAKRVDGIIIVIKYGETPLKLIEEMMESLDKEKIIGAVINRFDVHAPGYYRYTKYRRYYQTQVNQ